MPIESTMPLPTAPTLVKPSRLLIAGVAAWVLVVAAVGYVFTGSPVGLGVAAAPAPPEAEQPGMAQLAAMVDKLALRLKEQPDDAVGWAMLARSYNVLGRNAEALPAYAKAVQMRGDDANLLADYAGAMAMENQRKIGGPPLALVRRALALDPNNVKALSLLGMEAFERKDYAAAVLPWEKILALAPTDADLVQQVTASVAEARALGGLPATTATTAAPQPIAPPAAAASGAVSGAISGTVSGVVSLSASLAAQAAPSDTVFVFARAVEGPRMPLAVLRKQVKDLPFEFKLDDSLAMAPDARLSMHARVVVSARISKSGNAIAQPGDLVGQSATVALGSSGLKIEIAQTVPR